LSVNIGSIVMTIKAIDEASGVMGKISASMGLIGMELQTLGPGFSQLGQVIQGFAVGGPTGAAIVGIGEVVKALQDSVGAAANLQTVWTDLQSTLHLTGAAWDTARTSIDAYVESLRTTTTFSDTQLIKSFQLLSTYGMTAAQAMDGLRAATELAAAKHIDLETAATALGKAFQGNSMLLRRYGIEVATVTQETALGTEAIKEMGVKLETATGPPLAAFAAAMTAAGLAVNDASGKMLSHAAVVKEITAAWKGGTIDGTQLSAIVASMGINFQGSKALAMDYANVLGQVNTQFGGTAQAQANTYAGLQERLANAMQVVGEKIGAILLPALTSTLEAILPVIDAFGKGVDAIQSWVDAVGKIPAVQGAVSAFQGVWDGLQKSFNEAWNSVKGDFMPALQDLQNVFNELATALQPLWDALNEIWRAITGSTGDFNIFKALLEGLVFVIKMIADGIRLVIPIVSMFAQAFKLLADIITPAIKFIHDVLAAFFTWLTQGFQAFYDWLVGHSLWQDLWNKVWQVVDTMLGTLVTRIATGWFDFLKTGFNDAVSTITTTWGTIVGAITTPLDHVSAAIQGQFPELAAAIKGGTDLMKGNWLQGIGEIAAALPGALDEITSVVTSSLATVNSVLSSAWAEMQSAARSAFDTLRSMVNSVLNDIASAANALWNSLTHHSIWPDMMAELVAQTKAGLGAVQSEFQSAFETPTGIIQTVQAGGQTATSGAEAPAAAPGSSQAITLPVNVYLDGQLIQTYLEKRIVDTIIRSAGRSKRV